MANASILAAFERMWQHVVFALGGKSDISHTHDDKYYNQGQIDIALEDTKSYTDSAVAQKSQIQILTWEDED